MTAFEYASGLISIVIGLAVARVLGGIGGFLVARQRSASDWIVAAWCVALLVTMIAWWHVGWTTFRGRPEIDLGTSFAWSFATALFYLAAFVLVPHTIAQEDSSEVGTLRSPAPAFYLCLAAHFVAGTLLSNPTFESGGVIIMSTLVLVSAAGAGAKTDRARAIHLGVWLAAFAAVIVGTTPAIG
jgi:hypothetical protein